MSGKKKVLSIDEEVKEIQHGIIGSANRSPLPTRFEAMPVEGKPEMLIVDKITGKSISVPLFAYREVREAISGLFGDAE